MGDPHTRRVSIRASALNGRVRLDVEDTGPGIPEELHATIFEPFARGPHGTNEGVGLGLATVKRLTEAHGGSVGLRSRVGVGTVFSIELPLTSVSHAKTPHADKVPAALP